MNLGGIARRKVSINLTKGGVLGLHWERMEGSLRLFDAKENEPSVLASDLAGNSLGGGLRAAVFWCVWRGCK